MKKFGLVCTVVLLCLSCDRNRVFEQYRSITGNGWRSSDIAGFNVSIADTASAHNVYIAVRNTGLYEYSNLYLFVTAVSPDGNQVRDTVEIILADERGRWLGRGSAAIHTLYHPFRQNIRFPQRGIYQFYIEQAMWTKELKHINDIGLRVERKKEKVKSIK